jgi:C-terminal processing protease CtpA/Prc
MIFILVLISCDRMLLGPQEENTLVNNYDVLWKDFKETYGPFCVKDLDWDSLYYVYGEDLTENSSDRELYEALTGLLGELHDNHVALIPTDPDLPFFQSGIIGELGGFDDFSPAVIKNNYLTDYRDPGYDCIFGELPDNVGYMHLSHVSAGIKTWDRFFDDAFKLLGDTDGMIIDLRNNGGGNDNEAVYIAGRFSDVDTRAFGFRLKSGPGPDEYTPFYYYRVEPTGNTRYLNPIVVLTHRFTISAGETLTMSFRRLSHVTTMGDTTSGAFSDMMIRELPNGWAYTLSIGDWRDHDLVSYEGIGLAPDSVVINDPEDIHAGKDQLLETAIEYLSEK